MAILRKVNQDDFDSVYSLLLEFGSIDKKKWKQLFTNSWINTEGCKGYALVDKDEIVGYYSLLFSKRIIDGKSHNFCNWGNWVVKKDYRASSISMIRPLIKLKDYNVTVFTPNETVRGVLEKFNYRYLDDCSLIIPSFPSPRILKQNCRLCWGKDAKIVLNSIDKKIFLEHFSVLCSHLSIFDGKDYSYLVMTKIRKGRWPIARIHYISNVGLFLRYLDRLKVSISRKLSVVGLQVDRRVFRDFEVPRSFKKHIGPIMVKIVSVKDNQIDTLYSEEVLLR